MSDPAVGSILHTQASPVLHSALLASWLRPPLGPVGRGEGAGLASPLALLSSPTIRRSGGNFLPCTEPFTVHI